jgi:hypothetical protein
MDSRLNVTSSPVTMVMVDGENALPELVIVQLVENELEIDRTSTNTERIVLMIPPHLFNFRTYKMNALPVK